MMTLLSRRQALALSAATVLASGVRAATWPERPVRIVVPFAAGGTTDIHSVRCSGLGGAARRLARLPKAQPRAPTSTSRNGPQAARNGRQQRVTSAQFKGHAFEQHPPAAHARDVAQFQPRNGGLWQLTLTRHACDIEAD